MTQNAAARAVAMFGASVLALGVTGAAAQQNSEFQAGIGVDPDLATVFDLTGYLSPLENKQFGVGDVEATIGAEAGVEGSDSSGTVTVTLQIFSAMAEGNIAANTISDTTIDDDSGDGILSAQVVTGVQVSGKVENSRIGAELEDYLIGTLSVGLNQMTASAAINTVSNGIGLSSSSDDTATRATAEGSYDGSTISSQITNAFNSVNSIQESVNAGASAGSQASIANSEIGISLTDGSDDIAALMSVANNSMGVTYGANSAMNSAGASNGSFIGSAILSNAQLNYTSSPDETALAASILDSSIGVEALFSQLMVGDITVSGNTISTFVTGNNATNLMSMLQLNVTGQGAGTADDQGGAAIFMDDTGTTFDASLIADLGILSAQGNLNAVLQTVIGDDSNDLADTVVQIGASVVGDLAAGIMEISANTVEAMLTANLSSNTISQTGTTFDATAAVAGFQTNDDTLIAAILDSVQIGATLPGLTLDSIASIRSNTISASTTGNNAGNGIGVASVDMTALNYDDRVSLFLDPSDFGSVGDPDGDAPVTGGALVTNFQSNYGTTSISALVEDSFVAMLLSGNIEDGSSAAVASNTLATSAIGNTSINAISFAGDELLDVPIGTADVAAGIGNLQFNDVSVTAAISDSYAGVSVGGTISGSLADPAAVTVSGNTLQATTQGNAATNNVQLYAHTVTADGAGALAEGSVDISDNSVTGEGGAVVANTQVNNSSTDPDAEISAIITASEVGLDVVGNSISEAIVQVAKNTIQTMATGNSAMNQIGSIGTDGSLSGALVSQQANDVAITAALEGVQISIGAGAISDSTVSLVNNTMMVQAIANSANNTLGAIGYTSLKIGDTNSDYDGGVTSTSATAATSIVNSQIFTANVSATIGAGGVLTSGSQMVVDAADIADSVVTITGDVMQASATGNTVFNTLGLEGTKLVSNSSDGSAELYGALVNYQRNVEASVIASVTGHEIGLGFDAASLSILAAQQDGASATAAGSSATNKILLSGGVLESTSDTSDEYSFILLTEQSQVGGSQEISATVSDLRVGLSGDSAADSTLIASNNAISAMATNNSVLNSVELAFQSLATSAQLEVIQTAEAPVSAIIANTAIGIDLAGAGTDSIFAASLNSLQAQAIGNQSNSEMDIAAFRLDAGLTSASQEDFLLTNTQTNSGQINASLIDASLGIAFGTDFSGPSAAVENNIATASSAGNSAINSLKIASQSSADLRSSLINDQGNSGDVTATVLNASIAIRVGGAATGPTTVSGNTVSSTAYGNTASSLVGVATLPGSTIFSGLSNTQSNSGAITASVIGLQIGIGLGAGSSSSATVSNNTVSATAVGNSAINTINRSNF